MLLLLYDCIDYIDKDIIFSFFSLFEVSGVIEEKNVWFFFIDFKIIIFFLVNDGFKF